MNSLTGIMTFSLCNSHLRLWHWRFNSFLFHSWQKNPLAQVHSGAPAAFRSIVDKQPHCSQSDTWSHRRLMMYCRWKQPRCCSRIPEAIADSWCTAGENNPVVRSRIPEATADWFCAADEHNPIVRSLFLLLWNLLVHRYDYTTSLTQLGLRQPLPITLTWPS